MADPENPARPPRRFSAIRPPVRRSQPQEIPAEPSPARPVERPALSEARAEKASGDSRIAKVMARAGLCSRRDAEAWIAAGRVAVNGAVITSPALNVGPDDSVEVDGYPIDKPERTRLFLFHKTRGLVTTARDPEGRSTVFDALPEELPRLVTIGRLDINTEGLLLLTNDGGLARLLELPSTGWIRRYRVRANGTVDQAQLDALAKGVTIEGVRYAGIAAKLDRVQGANVWITMGLSEGKNREIKRVLEHLGLAVTRLIRVSFGPFQLGELADGAVEEVRTRVLRDQLGSALAKAAGVDFDGAAGEALPPVAAQPRKRAAEGQDAEPRRQVRRTQTADRRGRAVTVERITTANNTRPERAPRSPAPSRQEGDSRPPRRAPAAQDGGRPDREARPGREPRSAARPDRPARDGANRPRPARSGGDPARARTGGDQRREDAGYSPRGRGDTGKGATRNERPFGASGAPKPPRSREPGERSFGAGSPKPPRSRTSGERPFGASGSPKAPRSRTPGERPFDASDSQKAPRSRSSGERPFGASGSPKPPRSRTSGERPFGASGGPKPPRSRTPGDRPPGRGGSGGRTGGGGGGGSGGGGRGRQRG